MMGYYESSAKGAHDKEPDMTKPCETITTKLDTACGMVVAYRERIAQAATSGEGAFDLGTFVVRLAEREGARDLWARLAQAAKCTATQGLEYTAEMALTTAFDILAQHADDNSSGRGNDIRRAYADGVRAAAQDVRYL